MSLNLDRWLNWLESVELFGEKKRNFYLISNKWTVKLTRLGP